MAQVCNQEFFRAGEVSWNKGALINIILSTAYERKAPQGKILEFFLLDALKVTFEMRHLTHSWTKSGHFFLKSGRVFSIFKKGWRGFAPSLTFPMCAPVAEPALTYFRIKRLFIISFSAAKTSLTLSLKT